jgi:hypothetical protein
MTAPDLKRKAVDDDDMTNEVSSMTTATTPNLKERQQMRTWCHLRCARR